MTKDQKIQAWRAYACAALAGISASDECQSIDGAIIYSGQCATRMVEIEDAKEAHYEKEAFNRRGKT